MFIKKIICFLLLTVLFTVNNSCNVAQITGDKNKIRKIKTVAIMPFEKFDTIPSNIVLGCEESFKSSLMKSGIIIVERQKIMELFKENELSMNSLQYSNELVNITGADALLFGQIIMYNEKIRRSEYMGYDHDELGFEITTAIDHVTKKQVPVEKHLIKDKEHILNFKLQLRLVSTYTGETLLVMENSATSHSFYEKKSSYSLEAYSNSIVESMKDELESYLKEIKAGK